MTPRSVRAGAVAAGGLVLFYVAVVAGASGSWQHLIEQAAEDWYYLVPIVGGLGVQGALVEAGEVDVKVEPTQLDAEGATFKIVLDTHSVELSMDIARSAQLEFGAAAWDVAAWEGDGPGGHHREGELSFTAAGPATGTARLTLSGFSEPVEATWDLGSS